MRSATDADLQHLVRGVEEAQQQSGEQLEHRKAHGHDADSGDRPPASPSFSPGPSGRRRSYRQTIGTMPLFRPNTGMKMKLWSLK